MRELTQAEVAYIAAMVDGEGAISILRMAMKRRSGTYWHYAVQVRISNNVLALHEWIQERCGGTIYDHGPVAGNRKPGYVWHIGGKRAKGFLQLVRPYLVVKGRQTDLALRFLALGRQMVPHLRAEMYAAMRILNHRGADNTTANGLASVTRKSAQLDLEPSTGGTVQPWKGE